MKEHSQQDNDSKQSQESDSGKQENPQPEVADSTLIDTHGEKKDESPDLWVELEIHAKSTEVTKRIDAHAERYAAKADIPGFRRGKVPADVIKERYRQLLIDEALNEVIESFVSERIRESQLQVVSRPELKDVQYEEGGDLRAKVRVEVLPEVSVPELDKVIVSIPADQLHIKPFDEEEQVSHFLEHNRRREAISGRAAASGDLVMLKHQAMNLDNRRLSPRKSMQVQIADEAASEIPQLDAELIGRSIGDEVVFQREYPRDFARKPWAGKKIEHHVKIEAIYAMNKPELDSVFLKSIGFDSREAFLERLKQEYESQTQQARNDRIMAAIAEQLAELAAFPVPETLLQQEMMQALRQNPALLGIQDEKERTERISALKELAGRNIRFSLLVEAVKKQFSVKAEAEAVENKLREMAESAGVPLKEVRKYYAPAERRSQLVESIERERALEILREKVTIKEV